MRLSRIITCFLITITIYFTITITRLLNSVDQSGSVLPFVWDVNHRLNSTVPLVLLWTDLFDQQYWHQKSYFNTSIVTCSEKYHCRFTRERANLTSATVVAFHLYDLHRYELPERQKSRNDHQSWIFISGESPVNFYYQNPSFFPQMLDDYFNGAITYKYDSPFSIFSHRFKPHDHLSNTSFDPDERQLNLNSLKKKSKSIIWMVSNCATFSQREKYVTELKQFIPVDIFGKCGSKCPNDERRQCQIDLSQYYFYLSFENSRCDSYITEKFWNIISNNDQRLVPIVLGPRESDYARIAPKQSYIHVDSYPSPKDLAEHLKYLIENPDQYLLHLQWREQYRIDPSQSVQWLDLLCPLCQMAHQAPRSPSSRLNFSTWFNPNTDCHQDDAALFRKCKQNNLNVWMSLVHGVKCP